MHLDVLADIAQEDLSPGEQKVGGPGEQKVETQRRGPDVCGWTGDPVTAVRLQVRDRSLRTAPEPAQNPPRPTQGSRLPGHQHGNQVVSY